jgi:hypothetical protein
MALFKHVQFNNAGQDAVNPPLFQWVKRYSSDRTSVLETENSFVLTSKITCFYYLENLKNVPRHEIFFIGFSLFVQSH